MDQEFTKDMVGSACLCSMMPGASAERLKCLGMTGTAGGKDHRETSFICLVPGIGYFGVWAQLGLSARVPTFGSPCGLAAHSTVAPGGWTSYVAGQGSESILVSKVEAAWHLMA